MIFSVIRFYENLVSFFPWLWSKPQIQIQKHMFDCTGSRTDLPNFYMVLTFPFSLYVWVDKLS